MLSNPFSGPEAAARLVSAPLSERCEVWSLPRRIGFRFLFVYAVLYLCPFPLDLLPWCEGLIEAWWSMQDALVLGAGWLVFDKEITVWPNGSGDTTYNYVQLFCHASISITVAVLWSLLYRMRKANPRLQAALRVYVRFWLAHTLLLYGLAKVFQTQFPRPSLDRLLQTFGDASPMGLLWTFMGASAGYNLWAGLLEVLGAFLLTARRTTLLGSLLLAVVLSNVVLLNFCYEVPVKLLSTHLLAATMLLIVPDLRRLAYLLIANRPVPAAPLRAMFRDPRLERWRLGGRSMLVAACFLLSVRDEWVDSERFVAEAPDPGLPGIWNVESMRREGEQERPARPSDWWRVIFDQPGFLAIQTNDGARERYDLRPEAAAGTLELRKRRDPAWRAVLTFRRPEPEVLLLAGTIDGAQVQVRLRRIETPRFVLLEHGFRWINEYPFNH